MTSISADQPVVRETPVAVHAAGRDRPLIVEMHRHYVRYRVKGTRQFYDVPHLAGFHLGAKLAAREHEGE